MAQMWALVTTKGRTPLHAASFGGDVETAELLIQGGADVGSRDNGNWTPLHSASLKGHTKMVELLIQHSSDVDPRNNKSQTPLHLAAQNGHLDTTKFLIECGAERDIADGKSRTPLYLASDNGKIEVASFLSRSAMFLDRELNPTVSSINSQNRPPVVANTVRPRGDNEGSDDDE
jgi:ankyrin repeat protein